MVYSLLKLIHLVAVVLFLGNIITGLFWMRIAIQTKDVKIIGHSMKGVILSDRLFTIPGVIVIIAAGVTAAIHGNWPLLGTGWISWSLILFSISGIAFMWKVAPLQRKIYNLTRDKTAADFDWTRFNTVFLAWEMWGLVALLTPLAAMVLMTLKLPH